MKLNNKRTILIGLAFLSICIFWQTYDSIIPLILRNTFHLGDTLAGGIMALDNVLALFMLPLFGALSDKTNTRLGKRMPFILFGTIAASGLMILIPVADRIKSLPLLFVGLGLVLIAMSTYRSPAVALMPDLTPKPLRSKGNAIINLLGAVGGILALGLMAFLIPKGENPNYLPIFIIVAALMLVFVAILFFTIKENRVKETVHRESAALGLAPDSEEAGEQSKETGTLPKPVKRSLYLILCSIFLWFMGYNAVTTAFSKYANVYWGLEGGLFTYTLMVAQIAAILSYIPVGIASSKFGRKKTILFGVVLLGTSFGLAGFFTTFSIWILILFAMAGIAWASINVNSFPMVVEMSKGNEVGKYTGIYYTFSMTAQIITPILSGAVLQFLGYQFLFPYAAIFVGLALITMSFVKHGDAKPASAKSRLEAFDLADD